MYLKALLLCSIICVANSSICKDFLRELADNHSHLAYCMTRNSVPVTMCASCKPKYMDTLKSYDLLYTNCSGEYFDKDRINLVASVQSVLTGIWSKAFCDDCFNNNNTEEFNSKNDEFYKCLNNTKEDPCEICKEQYLELNNFYINLDQHNNGQVCYDLQDSMNRTRNTWSKVHNCCHRVQNLTLFSVVLGLTFLLLMMFYGTTFFITKRQEHYNRVLFDEDPSYNSELPHSSRRSNLNNINNPTLGNVASSSNVEANSSAATTSSKPKDVNRFYSNNDTESSDEDLQINTKIISKEKIKNI